MAKDYRNLIVSPVGNGSQHWTWLSEASCRQFDLALVYFDDQPNLYRADADHYLEQRGFKFHLIEQMLTRLGAQLDDYDYIWCPDDDLATSTRDINRMFQIARQYRLPIAQPAIASGDVSFATVRQQPGLLLRYTQFVEVMCPLFSRPALDCVRSTLVENKSAWGIDWAWTRLLPSNQFAVIDAVGVHHTRPLQSGAGYDRMRKLGIDPMSDLRVMTARYRVSRRRRRQVERGTLGMRAIALDGSSRWVGPRWWNLPAIASL